MLEKKIQETIDEINILEEKRTEDEIFEILKKISESFDIHHIFLGIFFGKNDMSDSFLLYSTYLKNWEKYYIENRCYLFDPIFNNLGKICFPFEWSSQQAQERLLLQQKLMEGAYKCGITKGTTIPLWPRTMFQGFFTIINQVSLHPEIIQVLSIAANACAEKIIKKIDQRELNKLTTREKEILLEKSHGFSVKKISRNMKISETTVAFHLANIRKKLDVKTTEYAVLKFLTYS